MASGNFILGISAQITNLNDVQNQLKNLKLVKSISVPVELKNGQQAIRTVNTFKDKIGQTVREVKTFNTVTGKISSEIKSVSLSVEKANKALNPFGSGLEKVLKTGAKVAVFSVLASAINGVKDAMVSTIDVVKDFDDALTEFKKVSDLSGEALNDYAKQLGEIGSEVGRTTTQMIQASTEFKKGGFSDQDSAKLARVASLYQNIADSELSAGDSASYIISQMKAFNMTADQAIEIIDKTNEISNQFAVSSTDISTALTKQSASFASYGNDINETIALVTAGTEVLTGQAGKVARGWRTTGANIVKIAQSTKQLTYEVNGSTKAINLWNEAGTDIRSTYDIVNDIAKSWKDMSDVEKSALAIQLSGKNQMDVFLSTLTNFNSAQRAYATALGASGSAMKENEAYAESLQFKLTALQAEFERLVLGDGGISAFIKGIVDAGTAVLKFANSDLGKVTITVTASAVAFNTLYKSVKAYQEAQKLATMSDAVASLTKSIAVSGATFGAYALAIAGVSVAIYGLYKGFKYLFPSIDDTNKKLKELSQEHETAKAEVESLNEKLKEVQSTMDEIRSKGELKITDKEDLSRLERETAELRIQLALAREKEALRKAELQSEANRVSDKHYAISFQDPSKMEKNTRTGFNDVKQWYASETENMWVTPTEGLKIYTEQMKKSQEIVELNNRKIADLNEQVEHGSMTYENAQKEIKDYNKQNEFALKTYNDAQKGASEFSEAVMTIADAEGKGSKEAKEAILAYGEINSKILLAGDGTNNLAVQTQNLTDDLEENADQTDENAEKNEALNESLSAVSKVMKPIEKAQKEFAKNGKITSDTIIGIQSKAQKLGLDFTNLMDVLSDTDSTTQDVNDAFGSMIMQILEASGAFDNLTKDNADLVENLLEGYGVTNAYAVVQGQLAQQADGLVPILNNETDALVKQAQQLTNAKVTANGTEMAMNDFVASVIAGNNNPLDLSSSIANLSQAEQQAWKTAAAIRYALSLSQYEGSAESKISAVKTKYNPKTGKIEVVSRGTKASLMAEEDARRETDASIRRARNVAPTFDIPTTSGGTGGSKGGSGGTAKDPLEEQKKQLEDFQKLHKQLLDDRLKYLDHELKQEVISVEEHNNLKQRAYGQYFSALSSMGIDYSQEQNEFFDEQREWIQKRFEDSIKYEQHLIDRQIEALQKQKDEESDDYDDQIERLEEKRDKIVDALDEEIDLREEQKDAELDAIKEEQDAIKKKHDEVINNLKAQIDILKEEKSANKEAWDEKIAQLDAVNDELEKQKQLEEKLEALAKARATRVKIFKNGRFVYDVDREAVSEAQKNLNEYKEKLRQERAKKSLQDQRDAEQKNYDERIDALEKYQDQQDKYYDEIEDRLDDHYDAVDKKYTQIIDALKKQRDSEKKLYDDKIKNLQKLKKEQEKEYQDMIDDLNDLKDSYSDALEDMENVQNGFLDATKAFTYDYSKSMEENLKAFMEYVTGVKDGYKELTQAKQEYKNGLSESERLDEGVDIDDYTNIKNYSDPSKQHEAWEKAGSPSSSSYQVPSGDSRGSTSSLADKYGGIVTERTVRGHASGVASIGSDELAIVGENPNKEIVVGSRVNNGTLMSLGRGTGVINAKSTRTLAGLVNSIGGSNNLIDRNTSVVQTFSFDKIVLPNVTNANSFVEALSREFNNRAIQYGNIRR